VLPTPISFPPGLPVEILLIFQVLAYVAHTTNLSVFLMLVE
jgi:hypothetical protein